MKISKDIENKIEELIVSNALANDLKIKYIKQASKLDKRLYEKAYEINSSMMGVVGFVKDSGGSPVFGRDPREVLEEQNKNLEIIETIDKVRSNIKFNIKVVDSIECPTELIRYIVENSLDYKFNTNRYFSDIYDKIIDYKKTKREFEKKIKLMEQGND